MTSAKNIPPRRARRLGEILLALEHAQIVGGVSTTARVGHFVVYVVALGVVALAGFLVTGNGLAPLRTGYVARAAWGRAYKNHKLDQQSHKKYFCRVDGELACDESGEQKTAYCHEDLANFLPDCLTPAIDREQDKEGEKPGDDIRRSVHPFEILRSGLGFGNGTAVPRMAGEV